MPVFVIAGAPMHQAATSAQLILTVTASAALLVFQKGKTVDWKLFFIIVSPVFVMAFIGGYFAHIVAGSILKLVFAVLLVVAGFLMLRPAKERIISHNTKLGFWQRRFGEHEYVVNIWLAIPITMITGLVAGMVGISGGSFLVPLLVLGCGVPMRVAVGTSTANVAATAFMGFMGHSLGGDFNPAWALPTAAVALIGGLLGGMFSLKTKPENLKKLFAYTTFVAALFMTCSGALSAIE